ncbi:adenylate kinase [Butyrivibrio sp. CB08]|uniref:adenylate kinase n=1 Tax=Butyrivibrio sp. CB08 TaxID=2364879 RepID=UPI000EA95CAB|nr:adenylate kinase [Butyrivibrio sp. CB08]RKM59413.1 adenylate kinase [Butyrivibrio sp. CB08]
MQIGNKIIVIGCSGSGKSTFSKKLHEITQLPLIHLDNVWWKADRSHISRDEFDQQLDEIMQGEKWIVDGDYSRTYEVRFQKCDTVIFLDYSYDECMNGIIGRVGQDRSDMPWTEQELDPELVQLVENYASENRPVVMSLFEKYPDKKKIMFTSRSEASEWLKRLGETR